MSGMLESTCTTVIIDADNYYRSTTKDDDSDEEKKIDQPEKRDQILPRGESFVSLEARDAYGKLDNNTFEGAIGNWIIQGTKDKTLDTNAAKVGEVNTQGLPDW